jgi:uncharacterized protein YndB with AHSA1/START domain
MAVPASDPRDPTDSSERSDPTNAEPRPSLLIERRYDASPEQVWHAWTDPQALTRWFGPEETEAVLEAEVDVRVGGRYRIAFTTNDGERHDVGGVYQVVQRPHKLVFTWAWRTTPERESLVSILLQADGSGTRLAFRHEQFFDEVARDNHRRGWAGTFEKLDRYLQGAVPVA